MENKIQVALSDGWKIFSLLVREILLGGIFSPNGGNLRRSGFD